jgi:hypothetical protein
VIAPKKSKERQGDYMEIEKVLEMDVSTLMHHIELHIDLDHYGEGDNYLYYPNNNSRLLLAAHLDTVRKENGVPLELIRDKNIITAYNSVLGADDRAGVWALMKIIKRCKKEEIEIPNILFTNHEESGGTGMLKLTSASKEYFKHIYLGIALDRMGCNQYVTYNHLPKAVSRYMESFGWVENVGTFNDVEYFADTYRIPCVNVSVGYYNAHTVMERLHLDETLFSIERVMEMIKSPIEKLHKIDKSVSKYYHYDYYANYKKKGGNGKGKTSGAEGDLCVACGDEYGTQWIKEEGYGWSWVCGSCATYLGKWEDARTDEYLPYGYYD